MGKSKKVIANICYHLGDFFCRFDNMICARLYSYFMNKSDELDPWEEVKK